MLHVPCQCYDQFLSNARSLLCWLIACQVVPHNHQHSQLDEFMTKFGGVLPFGKVFYQPHVHGQSSILSNCCSWSVNYSNLQHWCQNITGDWVILLCSAVYCFWFTMSVLLTFGCHRCSHIHVTGRFHAAVGNWTKYQTELIKIFDLKKALFH